MGIAIERGLRDAWAQGAKDAGIQPDELTVAEEFERESFINSQFFYILGFMDFVSANSKANGGKLRMAYNRAEMWINRWNEARAAAMAMASNDPKLMWVLGPTETHCRSCQGFDGKVYRASVWRANGAQPQARNLDCHGYHCLCGFQVTSQRITPGRFPASLLN